MKLALALIVKGTNDEAKLLRRCLQSLAPFVDGIFITRTQLPGEKGNTAVANVAIEYGAMLSNYEWTYDFAAARNYNFSQVPKSYDYIMWTDADDVWRGAEKLRSTIEANPHTDAFGFDYLYDWDEHRKPTVVHRKTMIVKNDGAATWQGQLHEDLMPLRQLDVEYVQGIERLHMTDKDRSAANAKRNLEIAERQAESEPDDPRSYWNLANSRFGVADHEGAVSAFEAFLDSSTSDDEKYVAHMRIADVYKSLGKTDTAVKQLQIAIGLKPTMPEAFFHLGHVYYEIGDLDNAEQYVLQGLLKKPQVEKMIVYNPRDYDYNPMMLLARVYYDKNRPDLMLPLLEGCLKIYPNDQHLKALVADGKKEVKHLERALKQVQKLQKITDISKLRAALDKLPADIKSHPAVCVIRNTHFVKQHSSGKDLVIYCGNTAHEWHPNTTLGGSEEAVVNLSRELAKLGWNVTVYNTCGHKAFTVEGVTYRPFWEFNHRDKQDAVIFWRWVKPVEYDINADRIYIDLHDVIPAGEFTDKRLQKITKIFVKTQFHRSLFPNVPEDKITVIPNGMVLPVPSEKDPNLIINTSSPDRSLDVLPDLFKRVKERFPGARMQWAYGWEGFKRTYSRDQKKLDWMNQTKKRMDEAGIESLGRLSQEDVGALYGRASVFAYPTEFAEIDCISVKKAQAARCFPVTTDFGALAESNKYGVKVHSSKSKDDWNKPYQFHFGLEDRKAQDEWVDAVVAALEGKTTDWNGLDEWAATYSWPAIAKRWHDILSV